MSDLDKLKSLLNSFSVGYKERENNDGTYCIECKEGADRVSGYTWFYTAFNFDNSGRFIDMGAWE